MRITHHRFKDAGRMVPHLLAAGLSLLLLVACREQDPKTEPFTAIDSAGVTIVTSSRPLWERGAGWTLSPEPELVIGRAEGDERYLLSHVTGVRRLPDGRIAVLDAGSYRVRLYDRAGRHLMELGGEGDGPSEFRYPQFLGLSSDTLFVYEQGSHDLSWFSGDGRFLRASKVFREVDGGTPNVMMFGYLDDGVGVGFDIWPRPETEGLVSQPYRIWTFDLTSDSDAHTVLSVPGYEEMLSFTGGGGTLHRPYVFGKSTYLATSNDRIYIALNKAFSVQAFDRDGTLRRIVRRAGMPGSVTSSDFNEWVEQRIESFDPPPDERAAMRRSVSELDVAETMPALRSIAVDSEDNLWVEEWDGVGLSQGSFAVFRSDGAWLGNVELPEGLPQERGYPHRQLLAIGSDHVLGVWTDDLGVEQVRLYGIEKR